MTRRGRLNVLVCAVFLTILIFHQSNILNNHQPIQLECSDLQVDNHNNNHRKTWKETEILNELKGKRRFYHRQKLKVLECRKGCWRGRVQTFSDEKMNKSFLRWSGRYADYNNLLSISENDQFPEVEPDECVRLSEGDIWRNSFIPINLFLFN